MVLRQQQQQSEKLFRLTFADPRDTSQNDFEVKREKVHRKTVEKSSELL
jgi:hypothetical protein